MKTIRINLKTCRFLLLLVFGWWSRLTFSCVRDGVGWNLEALGNPLTNEQSIQFVGTIEDEIWSNSSWLGWFMCVFMVISTKSHWILRDQDLERHGLKTNIDQYTDGWISSIIKTRYYLGRKPFPNVQLAVGGLLQFTCDHGMKRCMLDRKWYLFPKSVNDIM